MSEISSLQRFDRGTQAWVGAEDTSIRGAYRRLDSTGETVWRNDAAIRWAEAIEANERKRAAEAKKPMAGADAAAREILRTATGFRVVDAANRDATPVEVEVGERSIEAALAEARERALAMSNRTLIYAVRGIRFALVTDAITR